MADAVTPLFAIPRNARTFEAAAQSYVRQGGQGHYLPRITAYFADRTVDTIVPAEIRQMALDLYPDHMPSTRNRHAISPARAVLYHAHELGWCGPMRIRMFRHPRSTKHSPVDGSWLTAFLNQSDGDRLFHLSGIVVFMNHTAARVSEAVNLRGRHVDLRRRIALLVKTKTDVMQNAYLTDELMFRLHNLTYGDDDHVFSYTSRYSVAERMRAVCERAGIPYRPPHSVGRYSFATNALKRHDIKTAMAAGRWKSSSVFLETYVQPHDAGREVAESINKRRYDYM
ncbi:MAG TPA: tyrosine-type recombinase/integrase [Devosia sp.]|jgi:integrase|nr:tyrosine-type recombinase/integrase [Devosia sp.]